MSRGRGRGRGGRSALPLATHWTDEPEGPLDYKPSELFPSKEIHPPTPPTAAERRSVAYLRALRANIHEGPLYAVLGPDPAQQSATLDPFDEGMPTYARKYKKTARRLPEVHTRPYVVEFFPKELWSTLEPERKGTAVKGRGGVRKTRRTLQLARFDKAKYGLDRDGDATDGVQFADGTRIKLEDVNDMDPDHRGDEDGPGDVGEEEEMDDDFEEDEDDMGDDYNAEGYFDDGGDDEVEYEEEDGGGGGGDYI